MFRSLIHYWRLNGAVALAAAVATAVLTGALLVGDSVRGSLRDLTLQRLGRIDDALVRDRFFREDLAGDLAAHPGFSGAHEAVAPILLLRASAVHGTSGARASRVQLHGVDGRFLDLLDWPDGARPDLARAPGQAFPSVVINESLQREIGAATGDPILLSFERAADIPRDTLLGERDPADVLSRLRLTVTRVVPDSGGGRFGLAANQVTPLNAFVDLGRLQRALDVEDRVNALLTARRPGSPASPDPILEEVLTLEDLGLLVRSRKGVLSVESTGFILRRRTVETVAGVAAEEGLPVRRFLTYLANRIEVRDRVVPYSTVTATDTVAGPPFAPLRLVQGDLAGGLADGQILLNTWASVDLQAEPGDEVTLTYFAVGPREELIPAQETFRLRGVVAMEGLGADRDLTPAYPGIHEAADIASWDPPFPVDLAAVRPRDEDYWDRWRAVPKAFVSGSAGRRLWSTRHGDTTLIRVATGDEAGEERFRRALLSAFDPSAEGFRFQAVREDGLRAASGATDFSVLFVSFSFFLILSAALLVALLFGLGVEQRAREIGLLLAVGYPVSKVRNRLLAEGTVVAAAGGLAGVAGGWAYAWLMMVGLRTVWLGAVGTPVLFLHVGPSSLALGWAGSVAVVAASVWLSVRRLKKLSPPALLAGRALESRVSRRRRVTPFLAVGGLLAGVAQLGLAVATGTAESMGLAFGIGGSLLVGALASFALWCRSGSRGPVRPGLIGMAARNSAWNPSRSILSMALVASASFIILLVAANRHELAGEPLTRESGTGGFSLLAESTVPLPHDLDRPEGRLDLGLTDDEGFNEVSIYPLRLLPGNDTSCLNLYEPDSPRVLGVPHELVQRGGFTFQAVMEETDNGWRLLETLSFEPGVIPAIVDANSAQWIWKLGIGDDVVIEDEMGEELRLRLVGLVQKSILQNEILISEADFLRHFPSRTGYSVFLIDAPPGARERLAPALEAGLDRFGFDAVSTARRLADFQAVENTYLSTFEMLGGLGLLLGTVGLGIVLLRNVVERRGELATLRAFGFRRRRLAWMVVAENGFLLVVGIAAGSASALLAVAPRLASGVLHLPWLFLGATLAVVLGTGMISCIAAVQGALRVPLLPVLKAEP